MAGRSTGVGYDRGRRGSALRGGYISNDSNKASNGLLLAYSNTFDRPLHKPCYKKLSLTIPDKFITRGRYPQKTYDIGTLNLASKFKGQTTDCLN
ncbi:Transthyretin-like family protein [Ostertagia ostertagi]